MSRTKTTVRRALVAAAVMLIAGAGAGLGVDQAQAQSRDGLDRRVRIHNQTGWTMVRFYASRASTSSWEEDILGSRVMRNGQSWRINIDDGTRSCVYDFRAEFSNGQVLQRFGVNVCRITDYHYTR